MPALEMLPGGLDLVGCERVGNQVIVVGVHAREDTVDQVGSIITCGQGHLPKRSD